MNYTISKLSISEFEVLIPLMKDCFGEDVDINYFHWKYIDNPAGEFVGFIATSDDNEVAAYYGIIPEVYIINGETKVIYQSCDTMTHSNHRRKGLFKKLAERCYDYLKQNDQLFIIGFGGEQSTPGFLKMGWRELFEVRYYFYPLLFSFTKPKINETHIIEAKDFSSLSHLLMKSNDYTSIHSLKTKEIFKWRISNPKNEYKVIVPNKVLPDSYLCYYISDNKLFVFDFSANGSKTERQLFQFIKSIARQQKLKGIIAFSKSSTIYSKRLKQNRFITNPFKKGPLSARIPFILLSTNENFELAGNHLLWNTSSFDHDSI